VLLCAACGRGSMKSGAETDRPTCECGRADTRVRLVVRGPSARQDGRQSSATGARLAAKWMSGREALTNTREAVTVGVGLRVGVYAWGCSSVYTGGLMRGRWANGTVRS
jgi:hypothetical protein